MAGFYVEKKATDTGEHLVHKATCTCLPEKGTLHYMGDYAQPPVWEAYLRYTKVSTCPTCLSA
jgi:hypothetical protein